MDSFAARCATSKAREAYSALLVGHSSEYDVVKSAILKAYDLVLKVYCQKFQTSKKSESRHM